MHIVLDRTKQDVEELSLQALQNLLLQMPDPNTPQAQQIAATMHVKAQQERRRLDEQERSVQAAKQKLYKQVTWLNAYRAGYPTQNILIH